MSAFLSHVDAVLAQPWSFARAQSSGRMVGYVGDDVPVELILAAHALPLRLYGTPDMPTPLADQYLERAFTPALRGIAQHWLSGALDFLDSIVLARTDDTAQRLYYYICELQRRGICGGPRPLIYDLARIDRTTSRDHSRDSTRLLAAQLGTEEMLLSSAARFVAHRRQRLSLLSDACLGPRPPLGSHVYRAVRASHQAWVPQFDDAMAAHDLPSATCERRLLLAGSVPPDDRLHRAIEIGTGTVVSDLTSIPLASRSESDRADSLTEIADCYYDRARAARAALASAQMLVEQARRARVDAAVLWLIEEDEGIVWELPRQVRALRDAGFPVLVLTRQQWAAEEQALKQLTHFVRCLERRS